MRPHVQTYFSVATLEFLRRGGRIGRASALLGSVLQVKPVLCIRDGLVDAAGARAHVRARAEPRRRADARGRPRQGRVRRSSATPTRRPTRSGSARELEPIAETLMIQPLGPVVGAHAGPGVVGVGCYPADLLPLGIKGSRSGASSARTRRHLTDSGVTSFSSVPSTASACRCASPSCSASRFS